MKSPFKIKQLIAGNWKMNASAADLRQLSLLTQKLADRKVVAADVMICPPAIVLMQAVQQLKDSPVQIGGQDCHEKSAGAYTGNISAPMLKRAGAKAVIIGHSERRQYHQESNKLVAAKMTAAVEAGLLPILCVGETLKERRAKQTLRVIGQQVRAAMPEIKRAQQLVIAYEPVWAIGSGLTPTLEQIAQVHAFIRKTLIKKYGDLGARIRILYGGSVNPKNAQDILAVPNVNGALVGGASLKASDFYKIIVSAQ
ncbi:MAG: triose-phosphate isomerase [Parvibaculales bacterium]